MYFIDKLYNPGIFQGAVKKKHYFEGWYFKHVDKDEQNTISIIPGISYEESRERSHAFIQIIDGSTCKTHYVRYPIDVFSFSKDSFRFKIADSSFSEGGVELNIEAEDITMKGRLDYYNMKPWPSSMASPNSMGWYAFIPYMECNHGVLSMHHDIKGQLTANNRTISFDKGCGYIEKDWGTSFPSSWIWLQSNNFDNKALSVTMSVARIPWHGKSFIGLLSGVLYENRLYRFTTYTGARIELLSFDSGIANIIVSDNNSRLAIQAQLGKQGSLQAPKKGAMTGQIMESLNSPAFLKLEDKKTGQCILEAYSRCCGMEVAGSIQELMIEGHL